MTAIELAYNKHRNLKLAAAELGMKWQTLYVQLRKAGIPVTGDKSRYGSDKDRLAARAELEFERLVPRAVNQNHLKFQAKCDFLVDSFKVDVKCSRLHQGSPRFKALRWAFSIKKQEMCADFMVCFALVSDDSYRVLLIPGELVRHYTSLAIPEKGKSKWLQYEIAPNDLTAFFDELREAA